MEDYQRFSRRKWNLQKRRPKSTNRINVDKANSSKTVYNDQWQDRPIHVTTCLTTTHPRPKTRQKACSNKRTVKKRRSKRRAKCKSRVKEVPSIPFTACFAANGRHVPCSGTPERDSKINWRPLGHALRAACTLRPAVGTGNLGLSRCYTKPTPPQFPAAFQAQQGINMLGKHRNRDTIGYQPDNCMPTAYVGRATDLSRAKGGAAVSGLCTQKKLPCIKATPNAYSDFNKTYNRCIGLLYVKEEKFKCSPRAQTGRSVNYRGAHCERGFSSKMRAKLTAAEEKQKFAWLINNLSNHYAFVNEDDTIKESEMESGMLQNLKSVNLPTF